MHRLLFILLLIPLEANAQFSKKSMMDSTLQFNRKMKYYNLINEGDTHRMKGDLADAEKSFLKARELTDSFIRDDYSTRISIMNMTIFDAYDKLGEVYLLSNNPVKAREAFEESARLRDANLPKKSIFRVLPRIGLGKAYFQQQDMDKAFLYFNQADKLLKRSTTSFYNSGPLSKELWFNKFEVALLQRNYKQAWKCVDRLSAGGMFVAQNTAAAEIIPKVYEMKGRYFLETGNYKKASFYLDVSKRYSTELQTAVVDFRILKSLALLKWTEGDIASATSFFIQLIDVYKNYIGSNFASMSEPERESFFAKLREDFDLFYAFATQNQNAANAKELNAAVYNNQLFSKALLLNEINKLKAQIQNSNNEALKAKLEEWETKKALLSTYYYSKQKRSAEDVNALQSEVNALERDLNRGSALLRNLSEEITWQQVQHALQTDEAAVEIIRLRKFNLRSASSAQPNFTFTDSVRYVMLVVSAKSEAPAFLAIEDGNSLEGKYLRYYRNAILSRTRDTVSYSKFWGPVKNSLSGFKRLIISADGVYNQINLNTLLNTQANRYLLDETNLVAVTNTKDLVAKKRVLPHTTASLYGRPHYRMDSTQVRKLNSIARSNSQRSVGSEMLENFRDQTFEDLPGTEKEVKGVEQILKDQRWKVQSNFGADASEWHLKNDVNPSVLHIATHGFFLPENSPTGVNSMIRSGIILAGVNNHQAIFEDGILTAYEATNLNLDSTFLIVLSACETGLGEIENGEGVYGLQRGFAVAGAKNLLMSLWKVDDFATSFLMEQFYRSWLSGDEIHDAVKNAQVELRRQYPEPYYWGAFILLGN
jgi:CHAT domain-containing protein